MIHTLFISISTPWSECMDAPESFFWLWDPEYVFGSWTMVLQIIESWVDSAKGTRADLAESTTSPFVEFTSGKKNEH